MRQRLVRGAIGLAGVSLLAGAAMAVPASAAPPPSAASDNRQVTHCGQVLDVGGPWTVANDIGPCPADQTGMNAGILIAHNGVKLYLNGHTITGSDTTNTTPNEQVGVVFANVKNSALYGPGTITQFDAGVAVEGGDSDLVTGVFAHDNIAHVDLTGGVPGSNGNPQLNPCDFGDGILTDNSSNDLITNNTATHNGPFSGIALVDNSVGNHVTANITNDQTVPNTIGLSTAPGYTPGPCGPFGANIVGPGRPDQDEGLRIEGPGAQNNVVDHNTSFTNMLEGIAVHSYICASSPSNGGPPPTPNNSGNTIASNTVYSNGQDPFTPHFSNGIATLQQGPTGVVCPSDHETITGNNVFSNANDGVYLGGRNAGENTVSNNNIHDNYNNGVELLGGATLHGAPVPGSVNNTIDGNTVTGNGHDGFLVHTGATGNTISGNTATGNATRIAGFDAEDDNPACDSNAWTGNTFGTVNQPCIH